MHVFLTGGTGHIGSHVLPALIGHGHDVTALARSDESAQALERAGAAVVRGELTDADVLREAAAAADGVVHTGSPGDASSADVDRAAAAALQDGLGPDGRYVHTGGIWVYGTTDGEVDEDAPQQPPAITAWRADVEAEVLGRGGASLVMPAVVYGGQPALLELAFGPGDDGVGRYLGNGTGHCTVVHAADVAELYALVLEAPAGTVVTGVAESVTQKALAEALSPSGTARAEPDEEAEARLGPLAEAMRLDQRVSSARARELGWAPAHVGVLDELRAARG